MKAHFSAHDHTNTANKINLKNNGKNKFENLTEKFKKITVKINLKNNG
jgi:hypothetical protein